jgi:glutamate dehydrogenase
VKTFDEHGIVTGEHRFLGIFTTTALHENVLDIPVISGRVREVIHRAGFPMESYSGQRMLEVLQNWPRSDLFSADSDSLYATTTGAITLSDRRRLRLFLRRDPYGRFYSCLVFLPRERYTTRTPLAMQDRRDRARPGALRCPHRPAAPDRAGHAPDPGAPQQRRARLGRPDG